MDERRFVFHSATVGGVKILAEIWNRIRDVPRTARIPQDLSSQIGSLEVLAEVCTQDASDELFPPAILHDRPVQILNWIGFSFHEYAAALISINHQGWVALNSAKPPKKITGQGLRERCGGISEALLDSLIPGLILEYERAELLLSPAAREVKAFLAAEYLGDGLCRIGDTRIRLEYEEAKAVEAILFYKGAATLTQLRDKTDSDGVNKTLTRIHGKYPLLRPFIILPGGKGKGGYRTTLIDVRGHEIATK
jgi:hypothetical protein